MAAVHIGKSPLRVVRRLLAALMEQNNDGRLKLSYCLHPHRNNGHFGSSGGTSRRPIVNSRGNELRFIMLNPGKHFQEVVEVGL